MSDYYSSFWYYKARKPLPMETDGYQHIENLLTDMNYKHVAEATVGPYWVSTVWLGLDHHFRWAKINKPNPRPVIFETMVFVGDGPVADHFPMWRYSTEAEAQAGHVKMVAEVEQYVREHPDGKD